MSLTRGPQLADSPLGITMSKINDVQVTTAKIADLNVTTGKLADLGVTTGKIAANAVTSAKVDASVIVAAGTNAFTGDQSFGTHKATNLAAPTVASDAATKAYVDALAAGLQPKAACLVVSLANIVLVGPQVIDGVAVIAGQRVLVAGQAAPITNGLYLCAAGAWTRTTDAAAGSSAAGIYTFIEEGTAGNADTGWICTSDPGADVIGTDVLTFAKFSTFPLATVAPVNVTKAAAAIGTSSEAARADHKHDITTAVVGNVGVANAEGVATSLARSDHTHNLPFAPVQTALAAASGSISVNTQKITNVVNPAAAQDAATKAYVDAAIVAPPTASGTVTDVATASTAGAAATFSRGDHAHTIPSGYAANISLNAANYFNVDPTGAQPSVGRIRFPGGAATVMAVRGAFATNLPIITLIGAGGGMTFGDTNHNESTKVDGASVILTAFGSGVDSVRVEALGNVALFHGSGGVVAYGGGQSVLNITNRGIAPTSSPTASINVYAESGALIGYGSSGTITTIAPA